MGAISFKKLGKYIEPVVGRNRGALITNLMGISYNKVFIPSIANIIGTDLSTYRIVHRGDFAFCPVTSRNGDRITIARYCGDEDCIISQAYQPFRVKNEKELNPEYLMMWVKRPEFDRYARFHSHGSVREIFSWDDMCDVALPVPDIEIQNKIVTEYKAIESLIVQNNIIIKRLEDTALSIYRHIFVDDIDVDNLPKGWNVSLFYDAFKAKYGKGLATEFIASDGRYPVYGANGVIGYYDKKTIDEYRVLITSRGSGSGEILRTFDKEAFVTNNAFVVSPKEGYEHCELPFIYCMLKNSDIMKCVSGSAQPQLTNNDMNEFEIIIPDKKSIISFCEQTRNLFELTYQIEKENKLLNKLSDIVLEKM